MAAYFASIQANTVTVKSLIWRFIFIAMMLTINLSDGLSKYAHAEDNNTVFVVMGDDFKPLNDAYRGFTDSCKSAIRDVKDKRDSLEVINSQKQPVVSIGTVAFNKVKNLNNPIVFVLTNPSSQKTVSTMSGVIMNIKPGSFYEAMKLIIPEIAQIGALYDHHDMQDYIDDADRAASALGIKLIAIRIEDPSETVRALENLINVDLFWMLPGTIMTNNAIVEHLMRFSFENNVPIVSFARKYTEQGAVAALSIDAYDIGAQAADIVNRIVAGAPTPIREYARRGRLTVNAQTASKLGIPITVDAKKRVSDDQ